MHALAELVPGAARCAGAIWESAWSPRSVLAPVALACIWLGGIAFTLLVAAVALGLAIEWLMLCRLPTARHGRALLRAGGLAYVALAAAALLLLRGDPLAGRANVLFLVLVVWAGDIGAYLVGRMLGGPRLAPGISPGKTWSGAVGGLLAAIAVGIAAALLLADPSSSGLPNGRRLAGGPRWRIARHGCTGRRSVGELRQAPPEVKDSSHLIPGHGGLFDRLDAVLASALAAALLALTLGRGVVLWQ